MTARPVKFTRWAIFKQGGYDVHMASLQLSLPAFAVPSFFGKEFHSVCLCRLDCFSLIFDARKCPLPFVSRGFLYSFIYVCPAVGVDLSGHAWQLCCVLPCCLNAWLHMFSSKACTGNEKPA
ncbi:MAG: hypothetical protein IKI30_00260 [Oxalobacter sp.]|nr:hypothetical protein [Oxalobacter sp.]